MFELSSFVKWYLENGSDAEIKEQFSNFYKENLNTLSIKETSQRIDYFAKYRGNPTRWNETFADRNYRK